MSKLPRPTRTTSYKLTIAGLLTKRREVAGEAAKAAERLGELQDAIVHLDAVLGLFGFTDTASLKPLRRMDVPRLGRDASRDRQRTILKLLREAPEGLATPMIASAVGGAFQANAERQRTRMDVLSEVRKVLHRLEAKGAVRREGREGEARVWRAA